MSKRLDPFEFISLREEKKFCTFLSELIETLEEAISRINQLDLSTGDLARAREHSIELLKQLATCINSNNLEEAQRITVKLQNIYSEYLAPFKSNQEIATIVKTNLIDINQIMHLKLRGVSTEPFTPLLPGMEKPKTSVIDYGKSANIGSGIVGANKITFENKI